VKKFCPDCEKYMDDTQYHLSKSRNGKAFIALAAVLKHKGDTEIHRSMHTEAIQIVVKNISDISNPGEIAFFTVDTQFRLYLRLT